MRYDSCSEANGSGVDLSAVQSRASVGELRPESSKGIPRDSDRTCVGLFWCLEIVSLPFARLGEHLFAFCPSQRP